MFQISQFKDINYCCRTCLNDSSNKMYEILDTNTDVAHILSLCTAVKVDKEDSLPKKLCSSCYNCLVSFYDFRKQAEKIDQELRNQTQNIQQYDDALQTSDSNGVEIKIEDNGEYVDGENEYNYNNVTEEPSNFNLTSENDFMCNICQETFYTKTELKTHLNSHTKVKNKCDLEYQKIAQFKLHSAKHKKKLYSCNYCSESFPHKSKLITHLALYHQDNSDLLISQSEVNQSFKCNVCMRNFKSVKSLSGHMKAHMDKTRILACSVCGKIFKKVSHLKRHELCHDANRPFKCNMCQKSFASDASLKQHMNEHGGIKPHSCPVCNKSFTFLSVLNTHLKVHTREKLFMCAICGKKFDCNTNLTQHTNRHLGVKLFACELCPKSFISKGELKSHTVTHTGERSYSCEECGATFTKGSSLSMHKLRHQGIRPFQCDTCTMRFISKDHLKRHQRIHTGEKPYRCDMCDRTFSQSNDLDKHRRAHLGDKLYRCSDCSESFRLKTELRQHISQHFVSSRLQSLSVEKTTNSVPNENLNTSRINIIVEGEDTDRNMCTEGIEEASTRATL